jgi:predicted  nucleic acid-binding Zn-ribbon protein
MAMGKETAVLEQRLQAAVDQGPREGEDLKLRSEGMQELTVDIEEKRKRLEKEIEAARQRGRDPKVRRKEVGDEEFSG